LHQILKEVELPKKIPYKLNREETTDLCREMKHIFMRKGDKICSAGDHDNRFYIILRGKVLLTI